MGVEDKIRKFFEDYKSFTVDDVYYMRGWLTDNKICLMRDWFNVLPTAYYFIKISDVKVSDNKLTLTYKNYEGKREVVTEVEITGYNAICEINDKQFPFCNVYYLESIVKYADWLVDKKFSGKMKGNIYCVLDLFRLGRLDFNENVEGRAECFGYFEKTIKAGVLHTIQFNDTLTLYRACKERDPQIMWYGLWSVSKQIPLNKIEFSEKISEKILKKVLTNARL